MTRAGEGLVLDLFSGTGSGDLTCETVACQYPRFHSTEDYVRTRRRSTYVLHTPHPPPPHVSLHWKRGY